MTLHEVPVESEADWRTTVVEPIRAELERLGIVVAGLSDDQLVEVSQRVSEKFNGEMPDVQELAIICDAVRFEAKLREPLVEDLTSSGWSPLHLVPRRPSIDLVAAVSKACPHHGHPVALQCPECIEIGERRWEDR